MDYKPILGAAIGVGAAGLAVHTAKGMGLMGKKKQFGKKRNMIKPMVDLTVGTALLGGAASSI